MTRTNLIRQLLEQNAPLERLRGGGAESQLHQFAKAALTEALHRAGVPAVREFVHCHALGHLGWRADVMTVGRSASALVPVALEVQTSPQSLFITRQRSHRILACSCAGRVIWLFPIDVFLESFSHTYIPSSSLPVLPMRVTSGGGLEVGMPAARISPPFACLPHTWMQLDPFIDALVHGRLQVRRLARLAAASAADDNVNVSLCIVHGNCPACGAAMSLPLLDTARVQSNVWPDVAVGSYPGVAAFVAQRCGTTRTTPLRGAAAFACPGCAAPVALRSSIGADGNDCVKLHAGSGRTQVGVQKHTVIRVPALVTQHNAATAAQVRWKCPHWVCEPAVDVGDS